MHFQTADHWTIWVLCGGCFLGQHRARVLGGACVSTAPAKLLEAIRRQEGSNANLVLARDSCPAPRPHPVQRCAALLVVRPRWFVLGQHCTRRFILSTGHRFLRELITRMCKRYVPDTCVAGIWTTRGCSPATLKINCLPSQANDTNTVSIYRIQVRFLMRDDCLG